MYHAGTSIPNMQRSPSNSGGESLGLRSMIDQRSICWLCLDLIGTHFHVPAVVILKQCSGIGNRLIFITGSEKHREGEIRANELHIPLHFFGDFLSELSTHDYAPITFSKLG